MKNTLIIVVVLILIGVGAFFFIKSSKTSVDTGTPTPTEVVKNEPAKTPTTTTTVTPPAAIPQDEPITTIGSSVNEEPIKAYHFGKGNKEVLFVGGIHGGYSWNTALVAYELVDYLTKNPTAVPEGVKVTIVPVLNPDGLKKTAGKTEQFTKADIPTGLDATIPGRFNGNNVDLNRNFDCDWNAKGTWQNKEVSGGARAFSEPESQAIRDYVTQKKPVAVVVWYSSAGGVYASNCHNGVLPETKTLVDLYANASGYPGYESFDYYEITGDMVNWLSKMGIPGISVLLSNHTDTEWNKNQKGIEALLKHYRAQ